MAEWQPIETAPKDGQTVYLRGPKGGKVRASYTMIGFGVRTWTVMWGGERVVYGSDAWMPIK